MQCPNPQCQHPPQKLQMAERHGIEIDYCPHCRGVWLDRGELDKIIERAASDTSFTAPRSVPEPAAPAPAPADYHGQYTRERSHDGRDRHRHRDHDDDRYYGHKPHRKKSLLGELFDFD